MTGPDEYPGVRAPVDRFVIYYRELANLEWFGQIGPSFCFQIGTGRDNPWRRPFQKNDSPPRPKNGNYITVAVLEHLCAFPGIREHPQYG